MGSLMAGWDSPVLGDENKVRARRNRSLTKEEVEAFWKQRRRNPEDGGEVTSPLGSPAAGREGSPFGSLDKARSSAARGTKTGASSLSPAVRVDGFPGGGGDDDGAGESPSKSRDWWTRSSWAFLNEPPLEEASGRAQSYKPQFHVARIATGNA